MSALQFFTHTIDGATYGAWYRLISPVEIEVIGVGMLEQGSYAGFSPESAARSILENSVRDSRRLGIPVPSLESAQDEHTEPTSPPQSTGAQNKDNPTRHRS